jgi:hypothetical protein
MVHLAENPGSNAVSSDEEVQKDGEVLLSCVKNGLAQNTVVGVMAVQG